MAYKPKADYEDKASKEFSYRMTSRAQSLMRIEQRAGGTLRDLSTTWRRRR